MGGVNTLTYIENEAQWDAAILNLPAPHVLQSKTWGKFKTRQGWRATRMLWENEARVVGAAQVLTQGRRGLRGGYIPKGPLVNWDDVAQAKRVLAELETFARHKSLLWLKIDPDVRADTPKGQAIQSLLEQRGWRASFEQIQFRNTMVLDLEPDLDTLLANMKSKWRYNIRLAGRRGVNVRVVEEEELPVLYAMYAKTARRNQFIIRHRDYYLDAWKTFTRAGLATPFIAEVEGNPAAMLILFHFGPGAWYMYGASLDNEYRKHMPNHLLQWEAIQRAKALGCTRYDMWGAPDVLEEDDPMWGVYYFKAGFDATFVPHIGAYDFAPRPLRYRLYAVLRPRLIAWAQRRYWRKMKHNDE